jgi:hypothetical protein
MVRPMQKEQHRDNPRVKDRGVGARVVNITPNGPGRSFVVS